jgi:hypothetical protein
LCFDACEVGVGTCAPTTGTNAPRHCVVLDATVDATGAATGDGLKAPICLEQLPPAEQNADGAVCADMGSNYIDACHDGSECDSVKTTSSPTPDNLCHKLCYKAGFTPSMSGLPDGGVVAMSCSNCVDTFGLFATNNPVGLCK